MNFYLLQLIGKWLGTICLFVMSLFGFNFVKQNYDIFNTNIDKNVSVMADVIEYKVITNYDSSIPNNLKITTVEGENGLVFKDETGENIVLKEVINEQITIGTGKYGNYQGIMTGYGPDCKTCSGRGYVYCQTREKTDFNLIEDGIYYNDTEYGEARVLAAATSEFPCGTIVEVDSKTLGKFTGIVLDTGYDMRKHLEDGIYHFDVAYVTEKDEMVPKTTDMSGTVKYNVQRWGW